LPQTFGISLDGWSDNEVHYLAVFTVGPGLQADKPVLLGFPPFEQKEDFTKRISKVYYQTLAGPNNQ
jgi:hypothetical protein